VTWRPGLLAVGGALLAVGFGLVALPVARPLAEAVGWFEPQVVFFLPTEARAVALTIDDGPDPRGTPPILDVLARHEAQATFFLIGSRVPGNRGLLERMRADGHELANHTLHERASLLVPHEQLAAGIETTHARLAPYGEVRWFRPGSAFFDADMLEAAARRGYRTALGDVFVFDPFIRSSRFHAWYILRHVQPGSVIVLHDAKGRGPTTAETLDAVLPVLRERGYRVLTLTGLEALVPSAREG